MTDTLFDAVLAVARLVGGGKARIGTATGGSTTTVIDTNLRDEADDYWNQGTAMIITDAGGASAAPEGEWGIITDFVNSTSTATIIAVTAAVATGDRYMFIPPRFSLNVIRNAINSVLVGLKVPAVDTTTLDTASNQTEYNLPATVTRNNLRRVWYQTQTDDANDNQWWELRDWTIIKQATGTQDVLVLPQLTADRDIMLEYVAIHPAVYDADDQINEAVHMDRISFAAAEFIYANEIGWHDNYKAAGSMANYFGDKARQAEAMHPIFLPPTNGRIVSYSDISSSYTGEVGKVRL